MTMEAFLVNPVRKHKRKTSRARKRKGGGLPSGLLSRMIRTYGIKRGMKEAWKEYRSGARNPTLPPTYHRGVVKRHRATVYSGVRRGALKLNPFHKGPKVVNPFGEEVMIVGNPRRRRVRRKRVRHNDPAKRRVHRRRHYSLMRRNPVRRVHRVNRRRYRRNPESTGIAISARRPMSLLMPVAIGAGGYFAADYIPIAIGMSATPMTRIGIKAAIAVGGGMLLSRFLGARNAAAFALGVGINTLNDVLRTYVFTTTTSAGLGTFVRPRIGPRLGAYQSGTSGPYMTGRGSMSHPFPS